MSLFWSLRSSPRLFFFSPRTIAPKLLTPLNPSLYFNSLDLKQHARFHLVVSFPYPNGSSGQSRKGLATPLLSCPLAPANPRPRPRGIRRPAPGSQHPPRRKNPPNQPIHSPDRGPDGCSRRRTSSPQQRTPSRQRWASGKGAAVGAAGRKTKPTAWHLGCCGRYVVPSALS
ncbi:uncharacterized protein BJX67DRAFT_94419 [Aspergillus lucknowensis]|uniref:Uncharacterized protein n=1 Tax=Aspergillus lucknowensis TaxID=176173 RepID=A0ABR4M5S2_9EURO